MINAELALAAQMIFGSSLRENIERLRREAAEAPMASVERLRLSYTADQLQARLP